MLLQQEMRVITGAHEDTQISSQITTAYTYIQTFSFIFYMLDALPVTQPTVSGTEVCSLTDNYNCQAGAHKFTTF